MTPTVQLFIVLLVVGLVLVGAEIFVPGGVLGAVGAVALFAAIAAGFVAFGPAAGGYVAIGVIVLVGVAIALWIRFFPRSRIGRQMTVSRDLSDSKATQSGLAALAGKEGEAVSDLRPGGFAAIDGRRVDVITRGEMIERGTRLRVVQVQGNRVIVSAV